MNALGSVSRSDNGSRWAGWLLLTVIAVATVQQIAHNPASPHGPCPRCCQPSVTPAQTAPLLAGWWWEKYYNAFESSLASRQGMLRFGAVGMLLALFVIWYRK
jgi:hypothetical protein